MALGSGALCGEGLTCVATAAAPPTSQANAKVCLAHGTPHLEGG